MSVSRFKTDTVRDRRVTRFPLLPQITSASPGVRRTSSGCSAGPFATVRNATRSSATTGVSVS